MAVRNGIIETTIKGGGMPAARQTDAVVAYGTGYIVQGSATVSIGDAPIADVTPNASKASVGDALPAFEVIIYDKEFIKKNEMA